MAITATFIGSNKSGFVAYWGHVFPCGEAVEIDAETAKAAKRHPEFKVSGKMANPDTDYVPASLEEALSEEVAKFDHDGDGKASKPKRKYTRRAK